VLVGVSERPHGFDRDEYKKHEPNGAKAVERREQLATAGENKDQGEHRDRRESREQSVVSDFVKRVPNPRAIAKPVRRRNALTRDIHESF
jgi:hypothetical protein